MNVSGSYRALLANSIAAFGAAIEIYNKPRIEYRDECTVILLVNAWELLLKAILSKNAERIFYRKRRNEPYRTYSISDALNKCTPHFPHTIDYGATAKNIEMLVEFRDNAVHFYNAPGFGVIIFALAQTAVNNYRDLVSDIFARDVADEITISLLPLSLAAKIDPVQFLAAAPSSSTESQAVREFTARLQTLVRDVDSTGGDTARLFTVFRSHLVSTKKLTSADLVVGVTATAGQGPPLLIHRPVDPNQSHPFRETDIITRASRGGGLGVVIGALPLNQHRFRAITFHLNAKSDPRFCWADQTGAVTRYSQQYVDTIARLTPTELQAAERAYRNRPTT